VRDLRPLDPLRSIKTKLGVLVVATVGVSATLTAVGVKLGLWPRYTVPVAVLVALLVTQVLARGMTSPLREMTAAARAMARGDYSRRVRVTSRDEVGELGQAFNRMAADLEAVDRQRRELVANVSHELRTPISALRAVLENVVDGVSPADPATLQAALEQTERLGRLVNQLLDLSRLDAGAVPLDVSEFEVASFLAAAVREAEVAGRPIRFAVDVRPAGLTATGDRERLHQLLANLLDNASRHSPPNGVVRLSAYADGGPDAALVLDVADEGPGIPAEEREAVFERFIRGGATHGDGGTGLGLAIARWVTDLHSGAIHVADTDRGCRIRVTLRNATPRSRP
jgi:signal transduction histidine kinase